MWFSWLPAESSGRYQRFPHKHHQPGQTGVISFIYYFILFYFIFFLGGGWGLKQPEIFKNVDSLKFYWQNGTNDHYSICLTGPIFNNSPFVPTPLCCVSAIINSFLVMTLWPKMKKRITRRRMKKVIKNQPRKSQS